MVLIRNVYKSSSGTRCEMQYPITIPIIHSKFTNLGVTSQNQLGRGVGGWGGSLESDFVQLRGIPENSISDFADPDGAYKEGVSEIISPVVTYL